MTAHELPIPPHFDPDGVDQVWRVQYERRAAEAARWAHDHHIRPSVNDESRICLLLVDCQNTFCIPGFELFVGGRSGRGAVEDNVRLCEFIYRNLGHITEITATLDTHTAFQIFHPIFWVNDAGEHPVGASTILTLADVEQGTWRVNPLVAASLGRDYEWVTRHALHYVRRLTQGRYPLMIWPYHAMVGGIGHALVSAVEEAVFFHGMARAQQARFEIKGRHPFTENYSVLSPEVLEGPDGEPLAPKNTALIDRILSLDALIVAGQAKSHCVTWTMHDLLSEVGERDRTLADKIYLLEDCTSPVVVPGVVDFTEQADEAFARFADAGVHVIQSTEPVELWAGSSL